MSAIHSLDLQCDHRAPDGTSCLQWVEGPAGRRAPTMREARTDAATRGWRYRHAPSRVGYDLCPQHADQRPGVDFPDHRK